jgi:hypothetical protein
MTVGMTDRNESAHLAAEAYGGSYPVYQVADLFLMTRGCPGQSRMTGIWGGLGPENELFFLFSIGVIG